MLDQLLCVFNLFPGDGLWRVFCHDPKFKAHVYTNWYMWDCYELEATPLPDDVVVEIKETTEVFKQSWVAYQTANL